MRIRRGILLLVLLCLALPTMAKGNWGADPATAEWPRWPYEASCGFGPSFDPIAVFSQPATAELGSTPPQRALRRFLAHPVINWVPRHNYRVLSEGAREARFLSSPLSSDREEAPELLSFTRRNGHWRWTGSGPCVPATIVGGRPAIGWDLAYDERQPGPRATSIEVDLGPGECASGQSQNKRAHPVFSEVEGKLLLTIWLSPPKGRGGQTCIGLVEPPLEVNLPGPLGERELYDGGSFPPRPMRSPSRGF